MARGPCRSPYPHRTVTTTGKLSRKAGLFLSSPKHTRSSGRIGVAGYSHGPPQPLAVGSSPQPPLARGFYSPHGEGRDLTSPLQPVARSPPAPVAMGSFTRPHGRIDLTREKMLLRLSAQANIEEKRIAELRARLTETLSPLDRERTCRELTRVEGERIKTSLGSAHVRSEVSPHTRG